MWFNEKSSPIFRAYPTPAKFLGIAYFKLKQSITIKLNLYFLDINKLYVFLLFCLIASESFWLLFTTTTTSVSSKIVWFWQAIDSKVSNI